MQQARTVIARAQGFQSLRLQAGIEQPSTYLLLVEWDSLEDHTEGFRESELFVRCRELIGPYFAAVPVVEHYQAPIAIG
jgi:heme-degrading monooxygenase HmoA